MPEALEVPPEAVLIRRAREARGWSPETAAPKTQLIQATQWRKIEAGKAAATDRVLVAIAAVLGITPERLEQEGRHEAAEILRERNQLRIVEDVVVDESAGVYPSFVGEDPFFRQIWAADLGTETEREMAIMAVTMLREQGSSPGRQDVRRRA